MEWWRRPFATQAASYAAGHAHMHEIGDEAVPQMRENWNVTCDVIGAAANGRRRRGGGISQPTADANLVAF